MANYRNVLVAVDFSDDSKAVVRKAQEISARNQATLNLLHVVEYTSSMYAGDIPLPEDLNLDKDLAEQAAVKLKALAEEMQISEAAQYVEIGIPKREIVRLAEERGADLIVVGSHGRHGLQLLLGSTANGVLHQAKCDVLALRVGHEANSLTALASPLPAKSTQSWQGRGIELTGARYHSGVNRMHPAHGPRQSV